MNPLNSGQPGQYDPRREDDVSSVPELFLKAWPLQEWGDKPLLLAVSGGADSMALLELVTRYATNLDLVKVIHCNHRLRGEESDDDEDFVLNECLNRSVECIAIRFEDSELADSSEEGLRRVRYRYIEQTASAFKSQWVALGHHLDDDLETFFLRLLRGTGLHGLAGIPHRREILDSEGEKRVLIRPLLELSRFQIEAWLERERVSFRQDSSNESTEYTRNRIRHELIPLLDELAHRHWRGRVSELMLEIEERLEADREDAQKGLASELVCFDEHGMRFPLQFVNELPWHALRGMLVAVWKRYHWPQRDLTRSHWNAIRQLLEEAKGTTHPKRLELPGGIVLSVRKKEVRIEKVK